MLRYIFLQLYQIDCTNNVYTLCTCTCIKYVSILYIFASFLILSYYKQILFSKNVATINKKIMHNKIDNTTNNSIVQHKIIL